MKIGVLYICTGKYSVFWDSFYQSSEKFFLPKEEKKYFVFTDNIEILNSNNIYVQFENSKGFPLDSLLRFDMFLTIKDQLMEMDYIYFFNSNMKFVRPVGYEILPTELNSGLAALVHPGYYNKSRYSFPYERNLNSTAYIIYNRNKNYKYFMGSLNGGKTKAYLKLIEQCSKNIQIDMKNGFMAIYHDESHLNNYLNGKDILELNPEYGFPEDSKIPFFPKIVILNKMKHAGNSFDKLPKKAYGLRLVLKLKRIYSFLIWRFQ